MAKKPSEPHPPLQVESAMDYAEHERTYRGFMTATKYGVLGMVVLVVILYFLINP
jgi:hypothetical protein